jgi:glycosyltransferase involved in cell wall biosynthesis
VSDRDIFFFNTWYRGHNNPRYAELLPRLERVDSRLLTFPRGRITRAATERAWRSARTTLEPRLLRALERRHRYAFVSEVRQLASLRVPAVVDVDDPQFERDAALLEQPNVRAYVVTHGSAARRFESIGVRTPWHVVPQGVALDKLDSADVDAVARTLCPEGTVAVGYVAAFLLLPGDRGGDNPLYDVSHLLELWDAIVARAPDARLILVGTASRRLRRRVDGRRDVVLTGRVPRERLLAHLANFQIALYPRAADQGVRAVKTAEYLGVGVPVVSYDYDVVGDVREARAGVLVDTPRDFVDAVVGLVRNPSRRGALAEAARKAGRARDWRLLAERYDAILDQHLPRRVGRLD